MIHHITQAIQRAALSRDGAGALATMQRAANAGMLQAHCRRQHQPGQRGAAVDDGRALQPGV